MIFCLLLTPNWSHRERCYSARKQLPNSPEPHIMNLVLLPPPPLRFTPEELITDHVGGPVHHLHHFTVWVVGKFACEIVPLLITSRFIQKAVSSNLSKYSTAVQIVQHHHGEDWHDAANLQDGDHLLHNVIQANNNNSKDNHAHYSGILPKDHKRGWTLWIFGK